MILVACAMALAGLLAPDATPAVDEIVRRALAVAEQRPERMQCRVRVVQHALDETKRVTTSVEAETMQRWDHGRFEQRVVRESRHGEHKEWGIIDHERTPISSAALAALHRFRLASRAVLWGHPVFVVRVDPLDPWKNDSYEGTIWIDAKTFVQLKGEFHFSGSEYGTAKLPPGRGTWLDIQEQHVWREGVGAVPTLRTWEAGGAGGAVLSRAPWHSRATLEFSCQ